VAAAKVRLSPARVVGKRGIMLKIGTKVFVAEHKSIVGRVANFDVQEGYVYVRTTDNNVIWIHQDRLVVWDEEGEV
jgi:hypothetical protein